MATIRDVAREAGVSVATVSRVFNDKAQVSDATRRHVRDAAERLNYWPNGLARSLITHRTHTVGVLLPELHGEFFSEVIRGIDVASRRAGHHLLVSSSHSSTSELIEALRSMRGRIDGLILMAPDVDAAESLREGAGDMPVVLLNPSQDVDGCGAISVANFEGAHTVTRHLLGLGHRAIATIAGPERNADALQRLEGYRAALRDAGLTPSPELEVRGDFTEPSGYDAARTLLARPCRPSAVFAGNDKMAVGAYGAFHDAGVRVPQDLAVVGFDDIETARYLTPPLTTVHVDAHRLGLCAVERLLGSGEPPACRTPRHERLPTTLVVRGSCGARNPDAEETRCHRADSPGVAASDT